MNTVSKKKIQTFHKDHPGIDADPLYVWYRNARDAQWRTFAELKADYRSAEVVGRYTVINIGGHRIRLILEIFYDSALVLIRHVLTHEEYETNRWRADAYKPKPRRPKAAEKKTSRTPPKKEC